MLEPIITKTPVQEMPLSGIGKNRLWIKRDDLLPFSFGGNKVRIAASFLEDCIRTGCDAMILYGDRKSNLCRVLSAMCAAVSMETIMISTSENEEEGAVSFNERMTCLQGTRILPCDKTKIRSTVEYAIELLQKEGKRPYYIYGNSFGEGNEGTAVDAYVRASDEILAWEAAQGFQMDYIFTACGTGSTAAGLTIGMFEKGNRTSVIGISISSRSPERARSCVCRAACAWYEKAGIEIPEKLYQSINIETAYNCGGYGRKDARVLELIRRVFLETSIPLDPTYTGKAFQGMLDYLADHGIHDKKILFLHTGGTPLFFDLLASESE